MLKEGDKAPAFSGPDQTGKTRTLNEFAGGWLLLYFYPKDDTPGCTREACAFRDGYSELSKHLTILGASNDSAESHKRFAEKYTLPFPLLAGKGTTLLKNYETDGVMFPKRTSFLIDPKSVIRKIYPAVKPDTHAAQILKDIAELTA